MKYDVFLSYSRKDSKAADSICEALTSAGLACFIDKQGIDGGANFPKVIANAIDESGIFLVLAGKNAYASRFTQAEILHAFKRKQRGCIIPYLLDDSPMPEDLEFLLGNANWVDSRQHPVSELPDIIKTALANPDKGTIGGSKQRRKWYIPAIISLLFLAIAGMALMYGEKLKDKKAETAALEHKAAFLACLDRADSLAGASASLAASPRAIESTKDQIQYLKEALAELHRADSLKSLHKLDGFAPLFQQSADPAASINASLDSLHLAWSNYARDSYDLWRITRSDSEARNALVCIDYALSIKPSTDLEEIKLLLTK